VVVNRKTGTKEWAETTLNIARGCEHGCRYCYARQNMVERFKILTPEEWSKTTLKPDAVKAFYGKFPGTVMMPSSHDIPPSIVEEFICVVRKLCAAGNDVLIVTKPHWESITLMCHRLGDYKDQMLFRFTIGSTINDVLAFWEPNAPSYSERIACLEYAFRSGFKTSVSCEPFLDGHPENVYMACEEYVTDSFWIGKLRHFNKRVKLEDATKEQIEKYVTPLKNQFSADAFIMKLVQLLNGRPFIKWKDSIQEVIERNELV
jgi:DNA repair photolyase